MKISTKGRYGLRALLDLAAHASDDTTTLAQIAERAASAALGGLTLADLVEAYEQGKMKDNYIFIYRDKPLPNV